MRVFLFYCFFRVLKLVILPLCIYFPQIGDVIVCETYRGIFLLFYEIQAIIHFAELMCHNCKNIVAVGCSFYRKSIYSPFR